jgi:hypothetical protein
MRTFLLSFFLLLATCSAIGQDLTCADFKEGSFVIPGKDGQPNALEIIREVNTQMEIKGDGETDFVNLEWIDDCTYRLTYEEGEAETDEQKRFINDNNGIVVTKIKIEGRCMTYKATITTLEGEKMSQEGKICKEE